MVQALGVSQTIKRLIHDTFFFSENLKNHQSYKIAIEYQNQRLTEQLINMYDMYV